jgi:hypothetical protein
VVDALIVGRDVLEWSNGCDLAVIDPKPGVLDHVSRLSTSVPQSTYMTVPLSDSFNELRGIM